MCLRGKGKVQKRKNTWSRTLGLRKELMKLKELIFMDIPYRFLSPGRFSIGKIQEETPTNYKARIRVDACDRFRKVAVWAV